MWVRKRSTDDSRGDNLRTKRVTAGSMHSCCGSRSLKDQPILRLAPSWSMGLLSTNGKQAVQDLVQARLSLLQGKVDSKLLSESMTFLEHSLLCGSKGRAPRLTITNHEFTIVTASRVVLMHCEFIVCGTQSRWSGFGNPFTIYHFDRLGDNLHPV